MYTMQSMCEILLTDSILRDDWQRVLSRVGSYDPFQMLFNEAEDGF